MGLLYEADPRHVEILTKSLGLVGSKPVCSPGVKDYTESEDISKELDDDPVMVARLQADVGLKKSDRNLFDKIF